MSRKKNITYHETSFPTFDPKRHVLDIFTTRKKFGTTPVLVFIHGGNWNEGGKNIYFPMGYHYARRGITCVHINYRLDDNLIYADQAMDAAHAVKWVKENIAEYGGDPENIFVSGHSAGGNLAGLITLDGKYFEKVGIANPVKGLILNDAAGIDMYHHLKEVYYKPDHHYFRVFTKDDAIQKEGSIINHLHEKMPRIMQLYCGKGWPSILKTNLELETVLKEMNQASTVIFQPNHGHIRMIMQFLWPWHKGYDKVINFIGNNA